MYLGDVRLGDTLDFNFTTRRFTTGAPFTLAGSPVVSAYVGASLTQLTAGITLSVDWDSVTGLNHITAVLTSGNGYATATDITFVITTGTVDSVSVVGEVIGSCSIEKRSALMPTTAARTLNVSAGGVADADAVAISTDTTAANNLETMLDGTGGQTLSLGALAIVAATGDAVTISTAGGNGKGVNIAANGSGQGILVTAGATGIGVSIMGGATSGIGLRVRAAGSDAVLFDTTGGNTSGLSISASGNQAAVSIFGAGTGAGVLSRGGATGNGLLIQGGATSGAAAVFSATAGNSDGITITGFGSGNGLSTTGGATNGHGLNSVGQGTGDGIRGSGGATNGAGIEGLSQGSGPGIAGSNVGGSGGGIVGTGGTTGIGIKGVGGATSGAGASFAASAGNSDGATFTKQGTGKDINAHNSDISGVEVVSLTAAGLATYFTVNSGQTYGTSVAGSVVKEIADNASGGSTPAAIATAVWNEAVPGAFAGGSAGFILGTNLNATITSRMATYTQPTGFLAATFPAGTIASTTNLTAGTIATVTNDVGITQAGADKVWGTAARTLTSGANIVLAKGVGVTGFNDLSAAQVNAEMVDVISVDTYAEPTGAPPATDTLANKIGRQHQVLRNKLTVTASALTLFNDAGSALWTKPLADNGTTYTESEGS